MKILFQPNIRICILMFVLEQDFYPALSICFISYRVEWGNLGQFCTNGGVQANLLNWCPLLYIL